MSEKRRQILEAALAVADEHGLAAVSMRAVAERVGLSAMALYPRVGGKDSLLDGIVEVMLAELLPLLDAADGDDPLTALANGLRTVARRHPQAFGLLLARPSVTPGAVRVTDAIYQALLAAGVPLREVPRLERLLSTFVIGFAASEVNGRFGSGGERGTRAREDAPGRPAHHLLAEVLDHPVDWDAEFAADLRDLRAVVDAVVRAAATG